MFKKTEKNKERLKEIGMICQQCRIMHKVSRAVVADRLGITIHDVCNFENGRVNNALIYDFYLAEFIY